MEVSLQHSAKQSKTKVNLNPTPSTNLLTSGDFFHGKKAKLGLKLYNTLIITGMPTT
jgi:hypothetical protein